MARSTLPRTRQCRSCPFRVGCDPERDIPRYQPSQHASLLDTIARPGSLDPLGRAMSCHYSEPADGMFCVGWLVNQLGVGNNIGLRIAMLGFENARDLRVEGPQHPDLVSTMPAVARAFLPVDHPAYPGNSAATQEEPTDVQE